MELIFIYK